MDKDLWDTSEVPLSLWLRKVKVRDALCLI